MWISTDPAQSYLPYPELGQLKVRTGNGVRKTLLYYHQLLALRSAQRGAVEVLVLPQVVQDVFFHADAN